MHIYSRDQQVYNFQRTEGEKWFSRLNTLVVGLNIACFLAAMVRLAAGGSNSMSNSIFSRSPIRLSPLYTKEGCNYTGYNTAGAYQHVLYDITPANIEYFVSSHVSQIRMLLVFAGLQAVLSLINRTFFELNIHELRYNFLSFKKDMLMVWEIIFMCIGAYLSLEVDGLNNIIINYLSSCSEAQALRVYNTVLPLIELQLSLFATICITGFNMFAALVNLVGKPNPLRELQKKDAARRAQAEALLHPDHDFEDNNGKVSQRRRKSERRGSRDRLESTVLHGEEGEEARVEERGGASAPGSVVPMNDSRYREPYPGGPLLSTTSSMKGGESDGLPSMDGDGREEVGKATLMPFPSGVGTGEKGGKKAGVFDSTPDTPPFSSFVPIPGVATLSPAASSSTSAYRDGRKVLNPSAGSAHPPGPLPLSTSNTSSAHGVPRGGGLAQHASFHRVAPVVETPVSSAMEVEDEVDEQKIREDERLLAQVLRKKDKTAASGASNFPFSSGIGGEKTEGARRSTETRTPKAGAAPSVKPSSSPLFAGHPGWSGSERDNTFLKEGGGEEEDDGGRGALVRGGNNSINSRWRGGTLTGQGSGAQGRTASFRVDSTSNAGGGSQHLDRSGRRPSVHQGAASSGAAHYGVVEHYHLQQQRDRLRRLEQASVDTTTEDTEWV